MTTKKINRVIVVMKHDLTHYPPVISVCLALRDLGKEVIYIGANTNNGVKTSLESKEIKVIEQPVYGGSLIERLGQQLKFKKAVAPMIKKYYTDDTLIWFVHYETVILFRDFFKNYTCIAHLLEFRMPEMNLRYRFLAGFKSLKPILKNAKKVVCCEYNRAQLTKALFNLIDQPIILPNKPYESITEMKSATEEELQTIQYYKKLIKGHKVILYQGGFMKERRLDLFLSAINELPEEFIYVLMGADSEEKTRLKSLYESDRCIFIPHIRPPFHLEITKLAHIGILSYIPLGKDIGQMINVLYCAPNKVFEYGKFGIPMICNNLPSMKLLFAECRCGELIETESQEGIVNTINKIDSHYEEYQENSIHLYNSVYVREIINEIIS